MERREAACIWFLFTIPTQHTDTTSRAHEGVCLQKKKKKVLFQKYHPIGRCFFSTRHLMHLLTLKLQLRYILTCRRCKLVILGLTKWPVGTAVTCYISWSWLTRSSIVPAATKERSKFHEVVIVLQTHWQNMVSKKSLATKLVFRFLYLGNAASN